VALKREFIGSPNYSSRGSGVRLVVLHTAEGARTYQSLGSYFQSPSAGVSSHTGIDDTPGVIGEYVKPVEWKAWTQGNANPYSVATELCAFAAWSPAEWQLHQTMLSNCAQWVAEECARFNIPIRRLSAAQAQGGEAGVCQHVDLGAAGGGHWDCGPGFPMDQVIAMAAGGAVAPSTKKGRTMIASTSTGKGYWTTTSDGALYAFGDAEGLGGIYPKKINGEIIGIAGKGTDGVWLLASDGGIFAFGSADFHGRPDRT
jgi:hypothetical protein